MEKKRSIGITIFGIFLILSSLFTFRMLFLLISRHILWSIYTAIYGLFVFITGIGILLLKPWARIMSLVLIMMKMVQAGKGTLVDINTIIKQSAGFGIVFGCIVIIVVYILIAIGLIYYLTRPKVKEQFK